MIAGEPCVLIADDDPVTLCFLREAVEKAGCAVLAADGVDSALRLIPSPPRTIDLLLLDRRMPGRDGADLLRELRRGGVAAPAIATSAEIDTDIERSLYAAGFAATLLKPATLADVHALLHRFVGVEAISPRCARNQPSDLPLLDDGGALAAVGGDRTTLHALRSLFARELAALDERLADATSRDAPAALGEVLHRLRASCGICGALRLQDAVARYEAALRRDGSDRAAVALELAALRRATQAALADDQDSPPSG